MSNTTIFCPKCNTEIDIDEVLNNGIEEKLRAEFQQKYQKDVIQLHEERERFLEEKSKMDEFKANEKKIFEKKLEDKLKIEKETIEKQIRDSQMAIIEQLQNKVNEGEREKIRTQELEIKLKNQENLFKSNLDLEKVKLELELKSKLTEQIKTEEEQKSNLKIKELEHKLEQQQKLAEEQMRKLDQGSMQTQGEVLEEMLEKDLRTFFPMDEVVEIKKGEVGADILLNVMHHRVGFCGGIIFECKNTSTWSKEWIEKLKSDMKIKNAHIAILVSKTFPKEKTKLSFFNESGVWVTNIKEVISLTEVLRAQVIRLKEIEVAQQGKGDKSIEMYDYLQSDRFRTAMQEIVNNFVTMKGEIIRERASMEKHWKQRDALIDRMMSNSLDISSQIQAIGGGEMLELSGLEI